MNQCSTYGDSTVKLSKGSRTAKEESVNTSKLFLIVRMFFLQQHPNSNYPDDRLLGSRCWKLHCNHSSWQNCVLFVVVEPLFVTETIISLTTETKADILTSQP